MSWLWRGFQSAVFYYVSCAPCHQLAYQRRRRRDNKRAKTDQATPEAENGLYRHPSPFNTNEYWKEEMAMGPGPPQRKQRDQRAKERERERQRGGRELATAGVGSSAVTGTSSADTVVGSEGADGREVEQERHSGEGWNRRRYQREDELLWGIHVGHGSRKGTPGKGRSRAGTTSSAGSYQYGCNPAVNDLHPPIVSTLPTNKSEMRWMLQPPPPARVMEGKERANRSRSGSDGSRGSGRSNASSRRVDTSLSRQVGERLIEERMKRDGLPDSPLMARTRSREDAISGPPDSPLMARTRSREDAISRPMENLDGQPHDRHPRLSNDSHASSTRSSSSQRRAAPPPLNLTSDLRPPASSRPPLSPIKFPHNTGKPSSPTIEANPKLLRPILVPMDTSSSLHVLQELVSPLSLDLSPVGESTSKLDTMRRATSPLPEAGFELPPPNDTEEQELNLPAFDSRFPDRDGWQLTSREEMVMALPPPRS